MKVPELILSLVLATAILMGVTNRASAQGSQEMEAVVLQFINDKQGGEMGLSGFDRQSSLGQSVVFETLTPPMFVIASEERGAVRILGYSLTNRFYPEEEGLPQLEMLSQAILTALDHPSRLKVTGHPEGAVGPLIRTEWGQGRFFNYYCPKDARGPNGRVYAGCTALAMGQIIRYYADYNQFDLVHSYQSGFFGTLTAQIGNYDWVMMDEIQVAVNLEISDLLYDLGVLLHTTYSVSGSSANPHRTLEAFHELGYTQATLIRRANYTESSWEEELYRNLSQYRPIWVAGGGHAFICDGYDKDGLLHFNLGASGYGNGFYPPGLVMGFPVADAITELEPVSYPKPPVSLSRIIRNSEPMAAWRTSPDSGTDRYRVYVDEVLALETSDTLFPIKNLVPGIHTIHVSSVGPDGESRWIGPLEVRILGQLMTIHDANVFQSLIQALGYWAPETEMPLINQGDLSRITILIMDRPAGNLKDLEFCTRLKKLSLSGGPAEGLDPGPLASLSKLQVLEWTGPMDGNPQVLGNLDRLSQLYLTRCPLKSWEFLTTLPGLMKFCSVSAQAPDPSVLATLTRLDEVNLSHSGLTDAGFLAGNIPLMTLNLSGNQLTEFNCIEKLVNLKTLDLSGNQLKEMLFTDGLQSLTSVNLADNQINSLVITSDLTSLSSLDLSGNQLISPGRLFLYTPALQELDLSGNRIRGMGTYRCPNLTILDVSKNQIIALDWPALHPSLKHLDISNNRISDLTDLVTLSQKKQLRYLSLSGNPVSKESFEIALPLLEEAIDTLAGPTAFHPLSPCYPAPADGACFQGHRIELSWTIPEADVSGFFDVYRFENDSLILLEAGLTENRVELDEKPMGSFHWAVALRTADSVYYSGIYEAYPLTLWSVPYYEGFESFAESESIENQSDHWMVCGKSSGGFNARVSGQSARNGAQSLEISGTAECRLPMSHLKLITLTGRFSMMIPEGCESSIRIDNLAGLEIRICFNPSGLGSVFQNGKLTNTFTAEPGQWMDYKLSANARNNQIFLWAGERVIVNLPWIFPAGYVSIDRLAFNEQLPGNDTDPRFRQLFLDDVSVQTSSSTGMEENDRQLSAISIYPNPCQDYFFVTHPESEITLSILDLSGRKVRIQTLRMEPGGAATVNVQDLEAGFYAIQLMTKSGRSHSFMFSKTGT